MKGRKRSQGWICSPAKRCNACVDGIGDCELNVGSQTESIEGLFGRSVEVQNLPAANEADSIGSFGRGNTAVETDDVTREVDKLLIELGAESIQLTKIEGTKIKEKVPVDKFVIDTKVVYLLLLASRVSSKGVLLRWSALERHEIQTILNDGESEQGDFKP